MAWHPPPARHHTSAPKTPTFAGFPRPTSSPGGVGSTPAAVLAATDRQLKRDAGLTTDDYEVFVRLSEADGHRLRMSDLASSVTNSPSRLSQRVDRLRRDGFVGRVRCDPDARVWWVVVTDAGSEKLEATAPGHVEAVREAFIDRLGADEIEVLASVLPRLVASLEND